MASNNTSNVYIHVIEDVINKVRDEFINNGGPGESVLTELQGIWEMKMMQAGAILGPIERNSAPKTVPGGPVTPVHDLNVPYEGSEEYETPTADLLFPPTPLPTPAPQTPMPGTVQTPLPGTAHTPTVDMLFPPTPLPTPAPTPLPGTAQTPLPGTAQTPPGTADSSFYNIPTGGTPITPNEYSSANENDLVDVKPAQGRPNPYMQPPSTWMNQRPPLDVNVAYVEGREESERVASQQPMTQDFFMGPPSGKRKRDFPSQYQPGGYIPQQDGAGDALYCDPKSVQGSTIQHGSVAVGQEIVIEGLSYSRIPQLDGPIPDPYDEMLATPNIYNYQGASNEDYNVVNTPAPEMQAPTPAPVPQNDVVDDDDEEPLNENDDDDLDDVDQGEDLNTAHLVLAQFDKVTRTKSRWKCTLKDGIMHINDKDILFNKATGEFDF